ncbi:MAG: NAD(P)H-dependent oxidoreductase [Opitutaceae bacterium]|nr:NAD(P)H-dependent oxidoreductase [Opitutaceae bacterium]
MEILVVVAHPNPGSFNRAIADTAVAAARRCGHEAVLHDLYEEKFDPLLQPAELSKNAKLDPSIARHCADLTSADGIVIVHPNWWGQPPAILKGWLDRVVRQGVAYEFRTGPNGEGQSVGLLKMQTALVVTTANTPAEVELKVYGDPLENLWKTCVFGLCGIPRAHRLAFTPVIVSTPEQRAQWLREVSEKMQNLFPPAGG